jgi:salicylate 5-hydroxylase small subunit
VKLDADQHRRVEALYADYARALDDGPLEHWPELFTEESLYLVIPRDNYDRGLPMAIMRCESRGMLEDRVRAVQETIMHEPRYLRHQITNVSATQTADGMIHAVANYCVFEVLDSELPKILSVGRYIDLILHESDDTLRFKEKRVVYDSVLVPNTIVYPL